LINIYFRYNQQPHCQLSIDHCQLFIFIRLLRHSPHNLRFAPRKDALFLS
jgi:hypothetical protein